MAAPTAREPETPIRREEQGPVRSVARATDVLLVLGDGPQSLGRIARRARLTKPTAHRLLASLAHRQMVIQDGATGDYLLGPGVLAIADAVMRGAAGLGVLVGPVLSRLVAATGETAALYVRAGLERMCVGQVESSQPVHFAAHLGASFPLHTGSMGKLLLAYAEDGERAQLLDLLPLKPLTKRTVTDRGALEAELDDIRRRGHATSRGERAVGVASLSAPVFAADGRVLAALSVIGPDSRLADATMAKIRPALLGAAQEITQQIAAQKRGWSHTLAAHQDGHE